MASSSKKPPAYTSGAEEEVSIINHLVYGGDPTYLADSRALYEMWLFYKDKKNGKMRFFYDVEQRLKEWGQYGILARMREPNDQENLEYQWQALLSEGEKEASSG